MKAIGGSAIAEMGREIGWCVYRAFELESDPRENEAALREALPALYLSFQTARSNGNQESRAQ
jgi:hypothetical protein